MVFNIRKFSLFALGIFIFPLLLNLVSAFGPTTHMWIADEFFKQSTSSIAKLCVNYRKEFENKDRLNLDKMKTMMNQSTQDDKLKQNEDLAKLRANTSLEKTILAAKLKDQQK
jgi:hypothetical protein